MLSVFETPHGVIAVDSVNYLNADSQGFVVVSGSHGGLYAAYKAAAAGARAIILNDAGVGLQNAGIACLEYCDRLGMAAAVVSHNSARIGDVADMLRRGIISHANRLAIAVDCIPGTECVPAAIYLKNAQQSLAVPSPYEETRFLISDGPPRIICIDSASLVQIEDTGHIVITGSHGGLIGGRREKAFNVKARIAVFNDAGVGVDQAGIGRLDPLDELGVAAMTVAHTSARIGDSRSTYYEGVISHVNQQAIALGASKGKTVREFVERFCRSEIP